MNCAVCNKPVYDNFANGLCATCLEQWKSQVLYQKKTDTMTVEEVISELKERISDLVPYIEADDGDSEYFQGVQEGYILSIAMLTCEVVEGTIRPAY